MNESVLMVVLRLIHITAGVFWVGTAVLIAWFLIPTRKAVGFAGFNFVEALMLHKKLRVYLIATMALTVLSGLTMYTRYMIITHGEWGSSTMGKVLGFGALCGIISGGLGASSGKRTGDKTVVIMDAVRSAGGTPTAAQEAELAAIESKAASEMKLVAALLVIAVAAMASARYL